MNLYIIRTYIHYDDDKQVYLDGICKEKISEQTGKITDIEYLLYRYRVFINIFDKGSDKNINISLIIPSYIVDNNGINTGDNVNLELLYKKSVISDDNDFDFYNPYSIIKINDIFVNKNIIYSNVLISNPTDVLIHDDFMYNNTNKFIFLLISWILMIFFIPLVCNVGIRLILFKEITK